MRWNIRPLATFGATVLLAAAECRGADEQQAIDALMKLGSKITLDQKSPGKPVVGVDLGGSKAKVGDMAWLKSFPKLRSLALSGTNLTDAGLKDQAVMKALQTLDLNGCKRVTDAGLKELVALKGLKELHLAGTGVTDAGLKQLVTLTELQTLSLGDTGVTDAGLKEVAKLKGLQWLGLPLTKVTNEGLQELAALRGLKTLDLQGTQVTDLGLNKLAALKNLHSLNVNFTSVTDTGLRELKELKELNYLFLFNTKATDEGVAELKKALPKLEVFGKSGTISPEQPPMFIKWTPLMTYYYKSPDPKLGPALLKDLLLRENIDHPWFAKNQHVLDIFSALLGDIAAGKPRIVRSYEASFTNTPLAGRRVIVKALMNCGDKDTLKQIDFWLADQRQADVREELKALKKFIEDPQHKHVRDQPAHNANDLDFLWSNFFITGQYAPVSRILDVFDRPDTRENVILKRVARWSLSSNLQQHPKLMELVAKHAKERPMASRKVIEELKGPNEP